MTIGQELSGLATKWVRYLVRLAAVIPDDGIADLDGRKKVKRTSGTWPLWVLVFTLAFASITNLADRAAVHKAGWAASMVGAGMALSVPVIVHFAIKTKGRWGIGLWVVSAVFAIVSGTMQYLVYAPDGDFIFGRYHLEAIAFGYGVPIAECVLAAAAAVFSRQQVSDISDKEIDVTNTSFQQAQQANDAEHKRQLDLIAANARADAKRIKAETSVKNSVKNSVKFNTDDSVKFNTRESEISAVNLTPTTESKADLRRLQLVEILHQFNTPEDINKSAIASQLGCTRQTISNDIKALESAGKISLNGKVAVT